MNIIDKRLASNSNKPKRKVKAIKLPIESLIIRAIDIWLLTKRLNDEYIDRQIPAKIMIPLNNLNAYFEDLGISFMDLAKTNYNDGLAVDIISFTCDPTKIGENPIITEMLRPIILFKGQVVCRGQVILSPFNKKENGKE